MVGLGLMFTVMQWCWNQEKFPLRFLDGNSKEDPRKLQENV